MQKRIYSEAEITKVKELLAPAAVIRAIGEFSPGRWWGFNGTVLAVLTGEALHVFRRRYWARTWRQVRLVPRASVHSVGLISRPRSMMGIVELDLGNTLRLTTIYENSVDLLNQLGDRRGPVG